MERSDVAAPRGARLIQHVTLALLAYVPLLATARGQVAADTKTYLYLDPARLLSRAPWMWDPATGFGTVSHQTIGYLFPMGPWFWFFERVGAPDWMAQRLWLATVLFAGGAGLLFLLRTLFAAPRTYTTEAAALAAALLYMLTPYTLQYASRLSALLLPWAGLPWLVALAQRALRTGGWRHPAIFALVVTTVGSVNATALVLAGLAPLLWIAFAVWVHREATLRAAAATVVRIGVLTSACSLWWVAGLAVQGGYGVDVLRYSETVSTVASTSIASEVLRGLGYWFFYGGDKLGPWTEQGPRYMSVVWLLAASFAVPGVAFLAIVISRWRYRAFAVLMVVLGTALSVGAYPYDDPPPAGALFKWFAESSSAGLAMRSTPRAVPILVLGLALGSFAGLAAVTRRVPRLGLVASALVGAVAIGAMQPLFAGDALSANLLRDEDLPQYWHEAAAHLDAQPHETRVLELPGVDFAAYRWGQTVDPITPGLMDRPYAARELIPQGSSATADLLNALDRRLQEGLFEPKALAPIARLMGAGDILLRSDLEYERFRTPRPRQTWAQFQSVPGLDRPIPFGDPRPNVSDPRFPLDDEFELVTPEDLPHPPPVAVFPVRDARPIVATAATRAPLLVSGDGEGLVHAAAAGLTDGEVPVLYSAALARNPGIRGAAIDTGAHLLLTDSNRRRARQWRGLLETFGYTEPPRSAPLRRDPADNRLPVFADAGEDAFTAARHDGVREVRATSYGNPVTYTPENRPVNAFDGDLETAWRAGDFTEVRGERIEVQLDDAVRARTIEVVQPLTGATNRFITEVEVRLDGESAGTFTLDESSRQPLGQELRLPNRRFRTLSLEVVADNIGPLDNYRGMSPVGFAEIRIGGVPTVEEVIDLPRDLVTAAGTKSRANPLTILLERSRWNPLLTARQDEELSIIRGFMLPTPRAFELRGEARLSAFAPSHLIDELVGIPPATAGGLTVRTSSSLHGSVANRGSAALDGDTSTMWRTGFREHIVVGAWIDVEMAAPLSLERLDLRVVADGRHSVPTRLRIEANGESRTVDVPPIADSRERNAVAAVPVTFAPLASSRFRVVIDAVRPALSNDYYDEAPIMRPVGIAELGIAGMQTPPLDTTFDTGCRTDLLDVDGTEVPVRVTGTMADANGRESLSVATCDSSSMALGAGEHVLRTTKGKASGLDIDSLVLHSDAPRAGAASAGRGPNVEIGGQSPTTYDLDISGATEPFWLVLKQSHSAGWTARADGLGDLGEPVLIDGFANGWLIDPSNAADLSVHLEWTPQRSVWIALGVSAVAALLCLAIALAPLVVARRRRSNAHDDAPAPAPLLASPWTFSGTGQNRLVALVAVILCGGGAALLAGPWVGAAVLVATAVAAAAGRRGRIVLAGGAVLAFAAAAGLVVGKVWWRGGPRPDFTWPSYFERAHLLAWLAVLLLASDAVLGRLSRRRGGPTQPEPTPPASPSRSHPT